MMVPENSIERSNVELSEVVQGELVLYKLKPRDMPINPDRLWHGKVIRYESNWILVESLEPGYEGMSEIIVVTQVETRHASPSGCRRLASYSVSQAEAP